MDAPVWGILAAVYTQFPHRLQMQWPFSVNGLTKNRQHGLNHRFCIAFFYTTARRNLVDQLLFS